MTNKKSKIAVIGIGLIGGSILKRLSSEDVNLIGVSRSQKTVNKSIERNIVNEASTDIKIIKDADIVFVCTPINKTIDTVKTVSEIVKESCIITDVASLKGFIIDSVNNSEKPVNFIGGHPMAGTEYNGIDAAFKELFDDAKWVLTPSKWSKDSDLQKLKEIVELLGAKPVIADPYNHDKAVSLISHMPLMLSQALFGMVKDYPDETIKELSLKLAASGFRDTTRIAGTSPELAKDMLIENRINVLNSVDELISYLSDLKQDLNNNPNQLIAKINEIVSFRREMYLENGKNIY